MSDAGCLVPREGYARSRSSWVPSLEVDGDGNGGGDDRSSDGRFRQLRAEITGSPDGRSGVRDVVVCPGPMTVTPMVSTGNVPRIPLLDGGLVVSSRVTAGDGH